MAFVYVESVDVLSPDAAPGSRRADRFLCDLKPCLPLMVRPGYGALPAQVRDVCTTGIGLVLDRPLATGTVLALHLKNWQPENEGVLLAEVVHATAQADRQWLIGCQLSRPLSVPELELFRAD